MIGQVEELGLKSETDMVALNCEALCAVTRMVLPIWNATAESSSMHPLRRSCLSRICHLCGYKIICPQLQQALNQELRSRRIYVTAVCPGPVKTEFFDIAESTGVIPLYKRLVMANPKRVVQKAIRDSIAGREISVYGITMKAFRLLCKMMPHRLLLAVMSFMND